MKVVKALWQSNLIGMCGACESRNRLWWVYVKEPLPCGWPEIAPIREAWALACRQCAFPTMDKLL